MIKLDTLRIQTPLEYLKDDIELSFFDRIERTGADDSLDVQRCYLELKNECRPLGVSGIKVLDHAIDYTISGKILGKEYYDLINKNNIEKVFETLNNETGIYIDTEKAIENSDILRCDVTENLEVKNPMDLQEYIGSLCLIPENSKFDVTSYKTESVVFKHKGRTVRERLIFYLKYPEIVKDKELIKLLDHAGVNRFSNVLRAETNIGKFQDIRDRFKVKENKLYSVLSSNEKPLLQVYDHVTKNINQGLFDILIDYNGMKLQQIKKAIGMETIVEKANHDTESYKAFLKKYGISPKNLWREIREFNQYSAMVRMRKRNKKDADFYIDSIRELLKSA